VVGPAEEEKTGTANSRQTNNSISLNLNSMIMKISNSYLLTFLLSFFFQGAFAHAIWLETNPNGSRGQQQEVRIYYGEYVEGLHESLDGNFKGELQQFTVWLVSPDNRKTALTCTPGKDYFTASFTPRQDGVYTLLLENTSLKIVDTKGDLGMMKPVFYGKTTVTVGKTSKQTAQAAPAETAAVLIVGKASKPHTDQPFTLGVVAAQKPLSEGTVTIFSPEGWLKDIPLNGKGEISFSPRWKGRYVAEVVYFSKLPGELNGEKYQSSRNVSTYTFDVQ
jgi:hypothetical protein